ncbi:MAG: glycosyltransferase, partial [Armatimonadia bacterium]
MSSPQLSIVMPVYNERPTVLEILQRVRDLPIDKEVIIVDNCSTDGTREILQGLS